MANIAILHYQVGGTDGVSLEIDKWKQVLERMGHQVVLIAGRLESGEGILIEELYHHREIIEVLSHNAFVELKDYISETDYRSELYEQTEIISNKLKKVLIENNIDLLIPNNIWSNTCSPPASIATAKVVEELQIPTIAHHHDFYWERIDGTVFTCSTVVEFVEKYMPPHNPCIKHVVINSLARDELYQRKGISSSVIPNVFDFNATNWGIDQYNADFRDRLGLKENDVVILQATRIVPRKGIEIAIEFTKSLSSPERRSRLAAAGLFNGQAFTPDSRIVLVLAGMSRDEITGHYLRSLKKKIGKDKVDALFIEDIIDSQRSFHGEEKIYSLWDTYVHADFVTYPSLWEGWGNQFLEAIIARLPIALFEYPVFVSDIKDKGFEVISFGNKLDGRDKSGLVNITKAQITAAADRAVNFLTDAHLRSEVTQNNWDCGNKNFSLESLQYDLEELVYV